MFKYLIRALANDELHKGKLLGYMGIDIESGFYPYSSTVHIPFINHDKALKGMEYIANNTELVSMTGGGLMVRYELASFISLYYDLFPGKSSGDIQIDIRYEMIELDMTDIMDVKSRRLKVVEISARQAFNAAERDHAFYRVNLA